MTKTTLFLIIDAGRRDYVRAESMPFLHGLADQSVCGSFVSPPGFAQRTAFFTGRYPDTSGNLSAFVFDPEGSPFRWLRKLGPLANVVKPYKAFFPARRAIKQISKWTSDCYHADPAWIPPKFAPFFRPCEDSKPVDAPLSLGAPSIFDLARENGMTYTYRAHPVSGNDDRVFRDVVKDLRAKAPIDLHVAQFSVLDQQGHHHGPGSEFVQKECLRELDRKIASLHAALSAGYDDWDLFVVADHGMANVERRVNILRALAPLPVKPARDYVVFVNSTLAVFWYLTEKGRVTIEDALPKIPGGWLLEDADRKAARIPMDRRWGDRLFAAHPGTLFWPDYFHVKDSTIRGMHGYLDKGQETYGMAVLASNNGHSAKRSFAPRPLVDVFPTLADLVGVKTPAGQEGASILER
ncbi:MAG: alkaline phosphatase family protein [Thermoplasmatota archaeon]